MEVLLHDLSLMLGSSILLLGLEGLKPLGLLELFVFLGSLFLVAWLADSRTALLELDEVWLSNPEESPLER